MGRKSFNLSPDSTESKLPKGEDNLGYVPHDGDLTNGETPRNENSAEVSVRQYESGENRRMLKNVIVTSV
ncbi:unnamed protein product, partial [Allacma fusca]